MTINRKPVTKMKYNFHFPALWLSSFLENRHPRIGGSLTRVLSYPVTGLHGCVGAAGDGEIVRRGAADKIGAAEAGEDRDGERQSPFRYAGGALSYGYSDCSIVATKSNLSLPGESKIREPESFRCQLALFKYLAFEANFGDLRSSRQGKLRLVRVLACPSAPEPRLLYPRKIGIWH